MSKERSLQAVNQAIYDIEVEIEKLNSLLNSLYRGKQKLIYDIMEENNEWENKESSIKEISPLPNKVGRAIRFS